MRTFCRSRMSGLTVALLFAVASIPALAQIAWVQSYDDALKQAAKEKKLIVLDISASW